MPASTNDYLKKTGASTVTALAAPGKAMSATSITVGSTTNYPSDTGIIIAIRQVDSNGELVAGTYTEWSATVTSGTTLGIVATPVYGSDQVYTAGSTTQVYIPLSSYAHNKLIDGILTEHSQDGTHSAALITSRTEDTSPDVGADFLLSYDTSATSLKKVKPSNLGITTGWIAGQLPAVSSVTENGNRSADITFASTVASILTPGMRIRTSRTVAAPTYMGGAFNGTNHYFTKVTATSTLSTITDNFTIMGFAEPTAYAIGGMCGRSDGTLANGFYLQYTASGQISVGVNNAGVGNSRLVTTYQSLPLNKKTHVAVTWASGTVLIYLDGVSVPVQAAVTAGTAPTTAGTGGDFSIGRIGSFGQYFTGYLSGFGVFNAVLSAATIRSYKNQVLSGSETNCIGAWSLNNTGVNQQAAGTNDLTATNSVSYTSGRSPYCMDANGVAAGTYDYAIVTKVATTVATVQYPEGNAIATSGGISAVAYSTQESPYGFPSFRNRVLGYSVLQSTFTSTATSAYTDISGLSTTVFVPQGAQVRVRVFAGGIKTSAAAGIVTQLAIAEDGAVVQATLCNEPVSAYNTPVISEVILSPSVGSHTYKAQFSTSSAGTFTLAASAPAPAVNSAGPAYIVVEVIG